MKNRIKDIRKHSCLSQEAFGKRLGVTGATISRLESGDREPTEQIILSLCREFDIDEIWLRTGEGAMLRERSRNDELAAFFGDLLKSEPDFRHRLISVLSRLSVDEWALLEEKARELAEEIKKADP